MDLNPEMKLCSPKVPKGSPEGAYNPYHSLFLTSHIFLSITTSFVSTSESATMCAAIRPEASVTCCISRQYWLCPNCKIGEHDIPSLQRLLSVIAIDFWMTSHAWSDKHRVAVMLYLCFWTAQRLATTAGRVNQRNSIRSLMQRGSGENRVTLLSDTSMKRHDISSGHVSASLPQQRAAAEHPAATHSVPVHILTHTTSHHYQALEPHTDVT